MVRPTMVCARSWRMAATVELSTPPLMATATVFAVFVTAAPVDGSSCVSDDNGVVLYVYKFDQINSKANSTAPVPLRGTAATSSTATAGGLKTAATRSKATAM